jgi:hypothetical protein
LYTAGSMQQSSLYTAGSMQQKSLYSVGSIQQNAQFLELSTGSFMELPGVHR